MTKDANLLRDMTDAVRKCFDACRERAGTSEIIGYAVCSDDTAITCSPIAASRKGFASCSYDNPNDFRFNPEEWDLQEEVDQLHAVGDAIYALYEDSEDYENNDNWHRDYRARIYELIVQALERLDAEGYFGSDEQRDEVFVMAWVADSDVPKIRGADWSRRLNRPAIHDAFVNWLAETDCWA